MRSVVYVDEDARIEDERERNPKRESENEKG